MNRIPFDTEAVRAWADHELDPMNSDTMVISVAEWNQIRRDLLAAADEIDTLMLERAKAAA